MKKTFTVSINNTPFTIEEDAYQKLDAYLQSIKLHFANNDDKDEIIRDIEARIAEKLSESGRTILTIDDISTVMKEMGTVHEIDEMPSDDTAQSSAKKHRRLYRDMDNAIIAGVASGLGQYFDVDPWIIRILFIVVVLAGGSGIFIYLIFWFLVPEAETTAQKLEMKGDPVTVATMSASIKEKIDELDKENIKQDIKQAASFPARVLRGVTNFIQDFIFPAIRIIGGAVLMIGGFLVAIGTSIGLGTALFALPTVIQTLSLQSVFAGPIFYITIGALYLTILIPAIAVFFAGLRAISRRSYIGKIVGWSLFGIWFATAVMAGIFGSRLALRAGEVVATNPTFQPETRTVSLNTFSKLATHDAVSITYVAGTDYSVVLQGREFDLDQLQTTVENDTLTLRYTNFAECFLWCGHQGVRATITSPMLSDITLRDASRLQGTLITTMPVTITTRDAASAMLELNTPKLTANLRDVSRITLSGKAPIQIITARDAARYDGQDFETVDTQVSTSDIARADIFATTSLQAQAKDASHIQYSGNPHVEEKVSDIASVSEK